MIDMYARTNVNSSQGKLNFKFISQQIKSIQGQCRTVLTEMFLYMQNNTGAPFPNILW